MSTTPPPEGGDQRNWWQRRGKLAKTALIVGVLFIVVGIATAGQEPTTQDDGGEQASQAAREDSGGNETTPAAEQQQEATDPGPVTMPRKALKTIEEQAADAAGNLQGVSEDALVPSEDGAKLILERGALDKQEYCAAEEKVLKAEAGPEAEAAFVRGWDRNRGVEEGLGASLYHALSLGCLGLLE